LTAASRTWGTQIQGQVLAKQRCELARVVHVDLEIEVVPVEGNSLVDVSNDVAHGSH
jgi:hypothetical protein